MEPLEDRCLPRVSPTDFVGPNNLRPISEVGNNVANPTWGEASTDLLRLSPVAYTDGISAPARPNATNLRIISDVLGN